MIQQRRRAGRTRLAGYLVLLSISALVAAMPQASARPLDSIKTRGSLSICAHPNALPFASRKGNPPGFQIELARSIAQQLGVGLSVEWVISGNQFRIADCDLIMDTIIDPDALEQRRLRASIPYQHGGVELAMRSDAPGIATPRDLNGEHRVGVMSGSMTHMILNRRGVKTIPFGFEDEMMAALDSGEIDAAAASPASIGFFNMNHPERKLRVMALGDGEPDMSWDIAVGMRRSDSQLRGEIDRAVERLLADGTVRTIYARYGIEHRAPQRKQ
ncbi:ABC transporter substrate-binding protein [Skermanella aerolata]|uniref:ABC transporter substrate-binding protein n=1 Tax=Skermanella aerolata TaxID=393310 RepID=A0A512DME1_9PROT|nr:transporter substrate-binding domain-containing protein [Skermanella aerolata]KJB96529.1 hypothetical protein N826_32245 [Skermanella aerolata KACC 11604]GEO37644.1 ABC transporter substrate-binding protein [Skermanella aerolata]